VNIKVGTYVDASDKLFEISDNNAIHADFMVYEKDVHLINEGQKIHFTVSNRPEEELSAIVFAIGKEFEVNSRAVHIHASINEKVSGLIPGMYISGHIHTDEHLTRTLPNDAIVTEGTKSYIFIVDNNTSVGHDHSTDDGHDHDTDDVHDHGTDDGHEHDADDGHDHDADDGHDHGTNESLEEHSGHENQDSEDTDLTFRMIEVITGIKDDGYTEVKLIDSLPENTRIVMNAAYYLLSDMKKEETEHEH
jgi:cobalt-zinc-cadmium efflux system membrane fusion protein